MEYTLPDWIAKAEPKYRYMLLSRLKQDCDYYLGNGNRNPMNMCNINEEVQIAEMKAIWHLFPEEDKPEWLTWEDILNYEKQMC